VMLAKWVNKWKHLLRERTIFFPKDIYNCYT
jgi:hypothetical protein